MNFAIITQGGGHLGNSNKQASNRQDVLVMSVRFFFSCNHHVDDDATWCVTKRTNKNERVGGGDDDHGFPVTPLPTVVM